MVFVTVTLGGDTATPATVGSVTAASASQTMAVLLYSSVLEPLTVLRNCHTSPEAYCSVPGWPGEASGGPGEGVSEEAQPKTAVLGALLSVLCGCSVLLRFIEFRFQAMMGTR